jgi:predicted transporter
MRALLFFFLFFSAINVQALDHSTKKITIPWFSIFISIIVLMILFSGILIQKRWKEKKNK